MDLTGLEPTLDLVSSLAGARTEGEIVVSVEGDRRGLLLPPGARLEVGFFARDPDVLRLPRVALRGEGMRLVVQIDIEGRPPSRTDVFMRDFREFATRLGAPAGAPVRLQLRAEGSPPEDSPDQVVGVWLEEPAIWGPPVAAAVPEPSSPESAMVREPARPNVIVYLIDTLRRDRLGCYGYERPVSPNIDRFAETATIYRDATAQSSWTKPSMASVFTGLGPTVHGATGWKHRLPESARTLPEILSAEGYRTGAFVGNPNVVPAYGFGSGFDEFRKFLRKKSRLIDRSALDWLEGTDPSKPFFLYVHTMDPHVPYRLEEPYASRFAPTYHERPRSPVKWKWPIEAVPYVSDAYDAEIALNDESFGRFLTRLKKLGLYDDTLIVLLSDHGEEFKEHGRWRHGNTLHRETLDIPLIIKYPRQTEGASVEGPVQHTDVLPTVLDWMALEVPQRLDGQSLLVEPAPDRGGLISHINLRLPTQYSLVDGRWKLIRTHEETGDVFQLYDRIEDPEELVDLAPDRPARVAAMDTRLSLLLADAGDTLELDELESIDPETEKELRALGYLD